MNQECEICKFENPKASVTAIIIRGNRLLVLKRNEEPFKGKWDLPGGYMSKEELPEAAVKREVYEELKVEPKITFIKALPGYGHWKGKKFPVLNHFYLCDIGNQEIELNGENSEYKWIPLKELGSGDIAFDSNQEMCHWLVNNFKFDIERIRELVKQLDPSAEIEEQNLYKAVVCGHVSKIYDGEKLVAMGWIFPRQTLLRRQAVVEDMIVDENYRGKGYGRKILKDLIQWAKSKNVEVIELTTNPRRIAANELYKSEGFVLHPTNHYLHKVGSSA